MVARETVADVGGPNGAAIGPDGAAYVCNNGQAYHFPEGWQATGKLVLNPDYRGGSIQRVHLASGATETLYDGCDGLPLNAPNDIIFDSTGGFWFTGFGFSDGETRRMGAIYYARADGSKISRFRADQVSPNGIGLSPDETTLYWADFILQRLWAVDLTAPGEMSEQAGHAAGRVVVNLPDLQWFDSLAVLADGRVCVATLFNGGITVIDPATGAIEHVPVPDPITTNICFGDEDMRTAWITGSATGSLFKTRWPSAGQPLPYSA